MRKIAAITEHGVMLLIMAIIVTISIFIIFSIVSTFLYSGGEEGIAIVALDSLSHKVTEVYLNSEDTAVTHNLVIQEGSYIIVAFNADDEEVKSGCYDEIATRPFACASDNSCLCLYEDTILQDFDDDYGGGNVPIQCSPLPADIIFVAPWDHLEIGGDLVKKWNMGKSKGARSIKREEQENLLLYGKCDGMAWGNQDVLIRKTTLPDRISQIFIAKVK